MEVERLIQEDFSPEQAANQLSTGFFR